jgi:hypothetical protein
VTSHRVAGRALRRRNEEAFLEGSQNPETASSFGLPPKDRRLLRTQPVRTQPISPKSAATSRKGGLLATPSTASQFGR